MKLKIKDKTKCTVIFKRGTMYFFSNYEYITSEPIGKRDEGDLQIKLRYKGWLVLGRFTKKYKVKELIC